MEDDVMAELPARGTSPDLSATSVADLLLIQRAALQELRRREVLRTANQPVGDYAEWLVNRALHGVLAPNSEKSFDVTCEEFGKVQVKGRMVSSKPTAGQLQTSVFRSDGFA